MQLKSQKFYNLFHSIHSSTVGGDMNANNKIWNSRINNTIGLQLEEIANRGGFYEDDEPVVWVLIKLALSMYLTGFVLFFYTEPD